MKDSYDFIIALENRLLHNSSTGGKVERSFWQSIERILSKQTLLEKGEGYQTMLSKADSFLKGNKRR